MVELGGFGQIRTRESIVAPHIAKDKNVKLSVHNVTQM